MEYHCSIMITERMDDCKMINLDEIRLHLKDELIPDHRERGKYVCPLCGSGSQPGAGHCGAFSIKPDGIHGKCFSCDFYGDIFDLEAQRTGVSLDEATQNMIAKYSGSPAPVRFTPQPDQEPEAQQSFATLVTTAHSNLKGSPGEEYLRRRGFTPETMDRFMLGVDRDQRGRYRIVIPHDRKYTYYCTRVIENLDEGEKPYKFPKGVKKILFNTAALYQDQPCFVVESQLCAISIIQEGGSAVALGGVSGKTQLINLLKEKAPASILILSLDNDEPGQTAQKELSEALAGMGLPCIEMNVAGDCKDPNELLQIDPANLRQNVAASVAVAKATLDTVRQNELIDYESQTTSASFQDFEDYLTANAGRPPVPTGFPSLDKILNGGLTAGLYVMGAISSLGKTSWMLNIADNIAASGRDVLYFSLEMSKYELIAKSISRLSFAAIREEDGGTIGDAFTTFEVMNSRGYCAASGQSDALQKAKRKYQETIGQHMWIFSGIGSIGTDDVAKAVEDHIRITGRTPVVFIDYLQILRPEDPRSSDKQNTDRAVVKLKTMSATHDIPVFCISSLNRSNYTEAINMAAFKESGAIEYGSDVLIGLQLYGLKRLPTESQVAYSKRISDLINRAMTNPQTEIEVIVLKNRNGQRGGSGKLIFDKKYNSFTDVPAGFQTVSVATPWDSEVSSPL